MNDTFTYYKLTYKKTDNKKYRFYAYKNGILVERVAISDNKVICGEIERADAFKDEQYLINYFSNHVHYNDGTPIKIDKISKHDYDVEIFLNSL